MKELLDELNKYSHDYVFSYISDGYHEYISVLGNGVNIDVWDFDNEGKPTYEKVITKFKTIINNLLRFSGTTREAEKIIADAIIELESETPDISKAVDILFMLNDVADIDLYTILE